MCYVLCYNLDSHLPNLIEHLSDDGNKHILHHPRQEEDHGDEVDRGLERVDGVRGAVHDVHPSFLDK